MNSERLLAIALAWSALAPASARAAACCAGSSSMPGLMTGDQAAQVSVSAATSGEYALSGTDGAVSATAPDLRLSSTRMRVDASTLLSDSWQAGVSTSWVVRPAPRVFADEPTATLLGDTQFNLSYEVLPELAYSRWKPRGFVFTQVTLPTGRSFHEAESYAMNDVSGQGVYSFAAGASFTKSWGLLDAYANPMAQWNFAREIANTPLNGNVSLGTSWGATALAGIGVNPGVFRIGARLLASYTAGRSIVASDIPSQSDGQWLVEPAIEASALLSSEWTVSASASDNGALGLSRNVALSRGVSLSVVHRWER